MQAMTYQGNVYGLPLNFKVLTLIYNKKLVRRRPRPRASWSPGQKADQRGDRAFGLATGTRTSTTTPR